MSSPWISELSRFVATVRQTQLELISVQEQKVVVLRDLDEAALEQLSQREGELVQTLQALLAVRQRILEQARQTGRAAETLGQLILQFSPEERGDLPARLAETERVAEKLRQVTWTHWVMAQRCYQHAGELLDFMAEGGHQAPVYERTAARTQDAGAIILDASA